MNRTIKNYPPLMESVELEPTSQFEMGVLVSRYKMPDKNFLPDCKTWLQVQHFKHFQEYLHWVKDQPVVNHVFSFEEKQESCFFFLIEHLDYVNFPYVIKSHSSDEHGVKLDTYVKIRRAALNNFSFFTESK